MAPVVLRQPRTTGTSPATSCAVEFFTCTFDNTSWQTTAIGDNRLLDFTSQTLLVQPQTAGDGAQWTKIFGTPVTTAVHRSFEVKIQNQTELLRIACVANVHGLPVGATPTVWPQWKHGAYFAIVERRTYRTIRKRLLAIQDMFLDLLIAPGGLAAPAHQSSSKAAAGVASAVTQLKDELRRITRKPRDYTAVDASFITSGIGAQWSILTAALGAVQTPAATAVAKEFAKVTFPTVAPSSPYLSSFGSWDSIDQMFAALDVAARRHAQQKIVQTHQLSTLVRDHAAAREHFFSSLEAVYEASKKMAPMSTTSSGGSGFQRGVHGSVIEEAFREWLKTRVAPFAVSTGAMVGAPAKDQLDVIVWDPRYRGAVVRVGNVAYVPAPAVRGIMEIKGGHPSPGEVARRLYDIQAIRDALCLQDGINTDSIPVLGVLVADHEQYETVVGKGGDLVISLFRLVGTDLRRNTDGFERLQQFLDAMAEASR